jgi:hypothetical protein
MRRLVPALLVLVIFVAGAAIGRFVVVPLLHRAAPVAEGPLKPAMAATASAAVTPFDECMGEALGRRMDPIEARHTCRVIADGL